MKIVVTGANGLLGSFLTGKLIDEGHLVTAVVRATSNVESLPSHPQLTVVKANLTDPDELSPLLTECDAVIHTAALVSFNPRRAAEMSRANVDTTRTLVNTCLDLANPPYLIHISSVAALGREKSGPKILDETAQWNDSDLNTAYGRTKYLSELEVFRGLEEGLRGVVLNPSVILAPGDWNRSSSRLFKYVWEENSFITEGSINVVDVRDVCRVVELMLERKPAGGRYILNGGTLPYAAFFGLIAQYFGKRPPNKILPGILLGILVRLEGLRSLVTGAEPLITRETRRLAKTHITYSSAKVIRELNFDFQQVEESIAWVCSTYRKKMLG